MYYNSGSGTVSGYIDLARNLSAVNGKAISQTRRSDGKYKPLNYLVRIRCLAGSLNFFTLNAGYPTRNAIVLAGAARDAMLKSAGVSRSNLETYQKELRMLMDDTMETDGSDQFFPGQNGLGLNKGGWGAPANFVYDYTSLVIDDPDGTGGPVTLPMRISGKQSASSDDWDDDKGFYLIDNWGKFRHNLTPNAAEDDIKSNVFSWAMSQTSTADDIIDLVQDEADEKPYVLEEFKTYLMKSFVSTGTGNPTSAVISVPAGLLKLTADSAQWEIEVVGVTEL